MRHKKPSFDARRIESEVRSLRAEEPNQNAIDSAVNAFLAARPSPQARTPRIVWRTALVASAVVVVGLALTFASRPAEAASLKQVADALRAQHARYCKTLRPDASGNLKLENEEWVEGDKQATKFVAEKNGLDSFSGYNGKLGYFSYGSEGQIDDVPPVKIPIEDLDSYLSIPNGRILEHRTGSPEMFSFGFGGVRFDLYIDSKTRLPMRRDVMNASGDLIEQNLYTYPGDIPDSVFEHPTVKGIDWCDYPALRKQLASQLSIPGETKEVGGVKIMLRAVLVGKHRLIALYTGGVKADAPQSEGLQIVGGPKPQMEQRPDAFVIGGNPEQSLSIGQVPLLGDGCWFEKLSLSAPFTLSLAAWIEDSTRPLGKGFHSKVAGRVQFEVKNPIYVNDPDRLLWKPNGGEAHATGAG